ncbi:LysM peptidoglycan-binding domain-containing protein [Bacillus sp. DNRA2]|uniref:cell wall hydrolase n=1 Tax=Bacillus sp. DNRA2 TaxID=2723053 RepID=UPI00145E41DD|nr:cell wall hydrolase [Bacillus sp. DNRA2]NMD69061.1 LysM peptidoglycan-binding domain-containing protein [Bacillus sp. DNRA2]
MKNMKKLVLASILSLSVSMFAANQESEAAGTHVVQSGESLYKIGVKYGVPVAAIKKANNLTSDMIYPGQSFSIPDSTVSAADKDLMARLVYAEAKGEPYAGKVAVATVILNRVDSPDFPNTVRDVIYQISSSGSYAFTPVKTGSINQAADAESQKAVNEALAFRGQGNGSVYFYNPNTAVSQWIFSRPVTVTIGNHRFAK